MGERECIYDNDEETLRKDRARIAALVASVDTKIAVIDCCTNGYKQQQQQQHQQHHHGTTVQELDAAEREERVDYFVLNKVSLQHQEALEALFQRELSQRFSLVPRNYKFKHNQGGEVFYEVSEMTLAVARVALLSGDDNDIVVRCCADENLTTTLLCLVRKGGWLLLVFYAALHLWRIVDSE